MRNRVVVFYALRYKADQWVNVLEIKVLVFLLTKFSWFDIMLEIKAMKRRVVILETCREFLLVKWNSGNFNETSLGAAYGSYFRHWK